MPSFVALVVDRRLETMSYSGRAKSDVEVDRWIAVRVIHVYLDNARYHHAKLVRDWLAQPERRRKRQFVPPYCPHLNWTCPAKVSDTYLIYAATFSNASGLLPPNVECLRRGL